MRFPRPLNQQTLGRHADRVSIPVYDRMALRRGVVHLSVGSFHRSHQAVYFDDLARRGLGDGWALTGVGLRRRVMKTVMDAQDGLYTVVSRGSDGEEARIVGAITRYLFAPEETDAVLDALVDPDTRVVTLTITAGAYRVDSETGVFDEDALDIVTDLAWPHAPRSAIGLIVEALDRRRRRGRPPFTVLSCDNVPANGMVARAAVVSMASLRDDRLARWIEEHVAFPSSMVDRITPVTTLEDRTVVGRAYGVRDLWPVIAEPFSQWVIEDAFCNGRPPLEEVGVQFVGDIRPYSLMKTRLLNGSHCALGYLGTLSGHRWVHDAARDPVLDRYLRALMHDEVAPLLPGVDADLDSYGATLRERFANHAVADQLSRLCRNGSAKVPAHLLSSVREARLLGRPHDLLTLAVSAWVRHLQESPTVDDPRGPRLQALARRGATDPRPLLSDEATFGSIGRCPRLAAAIERDLEDFAEHGVPATVAERTAAVAP